MRSSGFNALLSDGVLLAHETQLWMTDVFGEHAKWNLDLATGRFRLEGERPLECGAQLLGSAAPGPRSWLWGWANPTGYEPEVLRAANATRELGQRYGIPELTSGEVPFEADDDGERLGVELWAVSRVASGEWFGYRGSVGRGTWVYLLLSDTGLTLPPPAAARTVRVLGEVLSAGLIPDASRALASYATLRGISWDGESLVLPDGRVGVTFDDAGRVSGLKGHVGG